MFDKIVFNTEISRVRIEPFNFSIDLKNYDSYDVISYFHQHWRKHIKKLANVEQTFRKDSFGIKSNCT